MTTTSSRPADPAAVAAGLRTALDQLAAAMAGGDIDAVLAAESALQAATEPPPHAAAAGGLATVVADPASRARLLNEIAGARAALARCRVLGAGAARLVDVTLAALGGAPSYGRHGAGPSRGLPRRGLEARV